MKTFIAVVFFLGAIGAVVSSVVADDVTGIWQCIEYTRGQESVPNMAEQGKLQLNADGTYVQTISQGVEDKGTYAISGDEIKLYQHGRVKFQGRIENNTITIEYKPTWTKIVYQKTS